MMITSHTHTISDPKGNTNWTEQNHNTLAEHQSLAPAHAGRLDSSLLLWGMPEVSLSQPQQTTVCIFSHKGLFHKVVTATMSTDISKTMILVPLTSQATRNAMATIIHSGRVFIITSAGECSHHLSNPLGHWHAAGSNHLSGHHIKLTPWKDIDEF